MATEKKSQGRMIERVRERKERHKQRAKLYRVAFATLAILVILAGIALIPLPGPGWLIVAVGLGMLALEFDWAERLLEQILERIERVSEQASAASPLQKVIGGVLLVAGGIASVGAVLLWDIPYFPG